MIKIDYPPYQPNITIEDGKEKIFDEVRKKWVILTPEEWVRQNFLQYLIQSKKYPASLIAVEKELKLGELKKRTDIVVFDSSAKPFMIVECKEMNVSLDENVLQQAMRYHISIPVPYIVITNGTYCFAFEKRDNTIVEINELPEAG